MRTLPPYCLQGRRVWRAVVPLICIHIVEWHAADRVMAQFGFIQHIPRPPPDIEALHQITLRQRDENWPSRHDAWVQIWNDRSEYIQAGYVPSSPMHYHSQYMEWYRRITRRWMSIEGAGQGVAADSIERFNISEDIVDVHQLADSTQRATGEQRRRSTIPPPQPAIPQIFPFPNVPEASAPQRRRRASRRQEVYEAPPRPECDPVPPPLYYHPIGSSSTIDPGPSSSSFHPSMHQSVDPYPPPFHYTQYGSADPGPSFSSGGAFGSADPGPSFSSGGAFAPWSTPAGNPFLPTQSSQMHHQAAPGFFPHGATTQQQYTDDTDDTPDDHHTASVAPSAPRLDQNYIDMSTGRRTRRHDAGLRTNVRRNRRFDS